MRRLIFILLTVLAAYYIFSSNFFYAVCFTEDYFTPIYKTEFDTTIEGNTILIPLKYRFETLHGVYISVPDANVFDNLRPQKGICKYAIISDGKVLSEGYTSPPGVMRSIITSERSSSMILELNLPYPGEGDNLFLKLTVAEPMSFLSEFRGNITCFVRPKDIYS